MLNQCGWDNTAAIWRWSYPSFISTTILLLLNSTPIRCADEEASDSFLLRFEGHAVVFVLDCISLRDVIQMQPPTLMTIINGGAVAALCTRTAVGPSPIGGCLTVASGSRAYGVDEADLVFNTWEPLEDDTAGRVFRRCTQFPIDSNAIVAPYISIIKRLNERRSHYPQLLFALGEALSENGVHRAVIGCDDTSISYADSGFHRHAALIALDAHGRAPIGNVSKHLLMRDAVAPYGVRTNPQAFALALKEAWRRARFIVIDPGDTYRAASYAQRTLDKVAEALQRKALQWVDALLAEVLKHFHPDHDLLIVFTPTVSLKQHYEMGFLVAYGADITPGALLTTPTTRRVGLVTLTDIAPTLLRFFNIDAKAPMTGRPMKCIPSLKSAVEHTLQLIRKTSITDGFLRRAGLTSMCALEIIAMLLIMTAAMLAESALPILKRCAQYAAISGGIAATILLFVPLAYMCGYAVLPFELSPTLLLILMWCTAIISALMLRALLPSALMFVTIACGLTALVQFLDAIYGAPLALSSILGYSPYYGGRFYGLGNVTMAVMLGSSLMLACTAGVFTRCAFVNALSWLGIGTLTLIAIGHPAIGANMGGALTTLPAFIAGYIALRGWKPRWWYIVAVICAIALLLSIIIAIDLARGAGGASHFGRFALLIAEGGITALWEMVAIKAAIWWRAFRHVMWTVAFIVCIIAATGVTIAQWHRIQRLWYQEPAFRASAVAFIVAAIIGLLLNDSGPQTPATLFIYGWSGIALIFILRRDY